MLATQMATRFNLVSTRVALADINYGGRKIDHNTRIIKNSNRRCQTRHLDTRNTIDITYNELIKETSHPLT